MAINMTQFHLNNIIDTCSIWNVLSSKILYRATTKAGCSFVCTRFVIYESLYKPRKSYSMEEEILKNRLEEERKKGSFKDFHISIDDLQDVEVLQNCKNLSKGELSSIAFAKKMNQAFLTDDQGARKLAAQFIDNDKVQTTPQLFGWLFFEEVLVDSDKDQILKDHVELRRPLEKYMNQAYLAAMQYKLFS